MALYIANRIYLQLMVGDVEFPLTGGNTIANIHIAENVRVYLPMLSLTLTDATKFFSRNPILNDGVQIKLIIGVEDKRRVYQFRLFSAREAMSGDALQYVIQGYLDVPRYWVESTIEAISGSASSALSRIAILTGLTYDGISTTDAMVWHPYNSKYCEWARTIAEHAYAGPTSCVKLGVTADLKMRLINVADFSKPTSETFSNLPNDGDLVVTDYRWLNKSGAFNAVGGYKDKLVCQSLTSSSTTTIDSQTLAKNSVSLLLNSDIQSKIGQSTVRFAPIDCGNVSATYLQGQYQNRRLAGFYTFGVEIVTPRPVTSQLLDVVNCTLSKPGLSGVKQISGKYVITGKVTYVQGINFYHKLELYRHGSNVIDQSQV
jgi:hypothetical protein